MKITKESKFKFWSKIFILIGIILGFIGALFLTASTTFIDLSNYNEDGIIVEATVLGNPLLVPQQDLIKQKIGFIFLAIGFFFEIIGIIINIIKKY